MKDYYGILGVSKNASKEEIKKAYRELSLKLHPGKNNNDKFWEERFTDITEAYETLIDSEERKKYDEKLAANSNDNSNAYFQNIQAAFEKSRSGGETPLPDKNTIAKDKKSKKWTTIVAMIFALAAISRGVEQCNKTKQTHDLLNEYVRSAKHPKDDTASTPDSGDKATVIPDNSMIDSIELKNEQDESSASKEATEDWIISKIKSNTYDTTVADPNSITHVIKLYDIYFTTYHLVISMADEYTPANGIKTTEVDTLILPVADIRYITFPNDVIIFGTNKKSMTEHDGDGGSKKRDLFFLPFNTASETNIAENMRKAFLHLQKFYQLPPYDKNL